LFVYVDKLCGLTYVSEMKEILRSELTIMEEIGTGKFAVSCGFAALHLLTPLDIDDSDEC